MLFLFFLKAPTPAALGVVHLSTVVMTLAQQAESFISLDTVSLSRCFICRDVFERTLALQIALLAVASLASSGHTH